MSRIPPLTFISVLAQVREVDDRAADQGRGDFKPTLASGDGVGDIDVAAQLVGGEARVPVKDREIPSAARVAWFGRDEIERVGWDETPEDRLLSRETRAISQQAIETLPPSQREVITLRDIEGWTSDEVCNVLGITETDQRVLLQRARSKVRRALEQYFYE